MLNELKKNIALLSASAAAIRREMSLTNDKWIKSKLLASLVVVLEAKNALILAKIHYLKSELAGAEMSSRLAYIEAALLIEKVRAQQR